MEPFYDENFYYNNFEPPFYPLEQFNQNNNSRYKLKRTLQYATKTVYTLNQVIPLIVQIRPIIANTKNAIRVIKAVNNLNDLDLDEVEKNIKPIVSNNDESFENMIQ